MVILSLPLIQEEHLSVSGERMCAQVSKTNLLDFYLFKQMICSLTMPLNFMHFFLYWVYV